MSKDTPDSDGAPHAPSHLRKVLVDAGVGVFWSNRELARQSGFRVKRDTWARMMTRLKPGERGRYWDMDTLTTVAETLRKAGSTNPPSAQQLDRAMLADRGHTEVVSGDDLSELVAKVQGLGYADQLRLIQKVTQSMVPDEPR